HTIPASPHISPLSLHDALPICRRGRWRCAATWAGAFCLGGFARRCVSFDVRAARWRAVRQCQVTWMTSFGGGGSPSNTRSRGPRSEEHTSELQSRENLVCRLLL